MDVQQWRWLPQSTKCLLRKQPINHKGKATRVPLTDWYWGRVISRVSSTQGCWMELTAWRARDAVSVTSAAHQWGYVAAVSFFSVHWPCQPIKQTRKALKILLWQWNKKGQIHDWGKTPHWPWNRWNISAIINLLASFSTDRMTTEV